MQVHTLDRSPTLGVPSNTTRSALVVIMSLYLFWGATTSLKDILIPHLVAVAYVYIAFYGFAGCKPKREVVAL